MAAVATTAAEALACPMGEAVEETREGQGPGVFCRCTKELLTRETDSRSLVAFCAGDPTQCPTLQTWRDSEAEDQHRRLDQEVRATAPRALR